MKKYVADDDNRGSEGLSFYWLNFIYLTGVLLI